MKEQSGGLDRFRLLAAFLVVAIHVSPFLSFSEPLDFLFTRIIGRVAVPFFFMITGYYVLNRAIENEEAGPTILWEYIKKVGAMYVLATIVYIPVGIYARHYRGLTLTGGLKLFLVDGTFYHLWYFPACITGICFAFLLVKFLGIKGASFVSFFLYMIGLLGDSYYGVAASTVLGRGIYSYVFQICSYTRNGFFMAPIFILLGVIAKRIKRRSMEWNLAIMIISLDALILEGFVLHNACLQRHDSMYFMLLPVVFTLFIVLLKWNKKENRSMRSVSTWIYIIHPMVIVLIRLVAKLLHLQAVLVDNSFVQYLLVCIISYLLAVIVSSKWKTGTKSQCIDHMDRAWVEIDFNALDQNVAFLQSLLPESCELMPAVKAEAYGHGAVLIARHLNGIGVKAFCVACVDEGVELRQHGVVGEILILGYTHPKEFPLLKKYGLTQTVVDYDYAKILNECKKGIKVHLGIDSGMHRLGVRSDQFERICEIMEMEHIDIQGVFTHLAADDSLRPAESAFTKEQIESFYDVLVELNEQGFDIPKVHMLSSYGVLNYPQVAGDYARVGIALYGVLSTDVDEERFRDNLFPVLSLKTRIASVRTLHEGEYAGYGLDYLAAKEMKIATLTIGYADGLPRNLSDGIGSVIINGKKAPIIGRICMDQTIVDVSEIEDARAGEVATVIGKSEDEVIRATDLARQSGTIANEILSRLGTRLQRLTV